MRWKRSRFGDLVEFLPKSRMNAASGQPVGTFPFFTSSPEQAKWTEVPTYEAPALIFGTGGEPSLHHACSPFATSADCLVAKMNGAGAATSRYCYHYLKFNWALLEAGFRGIGLKHISKSYIEDLEIPYPSLDDQQHIATVLDCIDTMQRKRIASLSLTKSLHEAAFLQTFGHPLDNPKRFPLVRLGDVASIERGKFTPRPRNDPAYYGGRFPFIQTGDISRARGRLRSWTQTLNEKGTSVSRSFPPGTIVIAIVGATIGITAILDVQVYCPDSVVGIQVDPKHAVAEYIEMLLRFWRPVFLAQAPETARANINLETLRPLKIPLPALAVQQDFQRNARMIEALHNKRADALAKTDELLDSLRHDIFGELDA